ncbi:MAG: hypothetical protein ACJ713_19075 [Candidatus Sulfotelmatobacter sp.]
MRSAAGLQCTPLRHFAGVASHNRVLHIMGDRHVLEFDFDVMLKADTEHRFKKYSTGIQWGMFSPNQALRMEGLNGYDGGDARYRPLNMVPVGAAAPAPPARWRRPADQQQQEVGSDE